MIHHKNFAPLAAVALTGGVVYHHMHHDVQIEFCAIAARAVPLPDDSEGIKREWPISARGGIEISVGSLTAFELEWPSMRWQPKRKFDLV
jgi:hypothetical protein